MRGLTESLYMYIWLVYRKVNHLFSPSIQNDRLIQHFLSKGTLFQNYQMGLCIPYNSGVSCCPKGGATEVVIEYAYKHWIKVSACSQRQSHIGWPGKLLEQEPVLFVKAQWMGFISLVFRHLCRDTFIWDEELDPF